jgi:serine/threonine-protein kinase RsbW
MATEVREEKHFHKELVVPSRPDSIRKVEEFIDEVRDALEFKEDAYGNVMVAITEAVNNSIHHGNNLDESKTVRLICESPNSFRLIVEVLDEGTGFDPNDLGDPTSVENIEKPGGRGVFLMRHLSDEISFTDEGRRVRMVFNI